MDSSISGPLKIYNLQWTLTVKDFDAVRVQFRRLCDQKPNSLEFYFTYYGMEKAQVSPDIEAIRFCFEQALFEHGSQSVDLWLKYAAFELKFPKGDPALVSTIYERAIKRLQDEKIEEFTRGYLILTK